MEFSPLKRDIILLIVRDFEAKDIHRFIKAQLNISIEQTFHVIDYLIQKKFLQFNEGELVLTHAAYNILKERRLDMFSLKNIEKYDFKINENYLIGYIPESF